MLASALALAMVVCQLFPVGSSGMPFDVPGFHPMSSLALHLQREAASVTRDANGRVETIFGLPANEVRMLLVPVDRQRGLPEGYVPPDLTFLGGRQVRALARPNLLAMIEAANRDNVELAPISGYRPPGEQALAFDSAVWQAMARDSLSQTDAEARMARFVAPPGHSQHQLGTAIDFSTWDINYALQPVFAETEAGRWLEQNAWQFGFVLSYTRLGEERSGYAYEPWHYRWIGRELAAVLQRDGYLNHPTLIADDYLRAAEEILAYEQVP
jgi:D-alanyl-D-alanine carboxypeptidase